MFDARMEMDLSTLGPLAERAVDALESIAQSLGTLAETADLQAQVLTQHHDVRPKPKADVIPMSSLRSALGVKDDDRG